MVSVHVIGVVGLVLVFVIGTLRPVNIGVLALIATFLVATFVAGEEIDDVLAGFPPDLFVLLVGVTYLFGLVTVNGTLAQVLDRACGLLGDRRALVPWLVFVFAAIPTLAGALGPAGVAMLAPLCMGLGERYGIDRRLSALMVIHGSSAGNFSPLNGLAVIVNRAATAAGLDVSAAQLFFGNLVANVVLAAAAYVLFGGLRLAHRRTAGSGPIDPLLADGVTPGGPASGVASAPVTPDADPTGSAAVTAPAPTATVATTATDGSGPVERAPLRIDQWISLLVVTGVAAGALAFGAEIGFLALVGAALLHLAFPERVEGADKRIVWSVVLLICGVVTYVEALERFGTIDVVGQGISSIGVPLLVAFLLCLVAAATSAFASSAGLLGVLIPLAAPFLLSGQLGAAGLIVALAVSATVVDSTPFSSVGALTLANAPEDSRPQVFRTLLAWGLTLIVVAPALSWLAFVLPAA